jgi:hypothetical protein
VQAATFGSGGEIIEAEELSMKAVKSPLTSRVRCSFPTTEFSFCNPNLWRGIGFVLPFPTSLQK